MEYLKFTADQTDRVKKQLIRIKTLRKSSNETGNNMYSSNSCNENSKISTYVLNINKN